MKKLNKFTSNNLKFCDYILFQEYEQGIYDGSEYQYNISKPILAIYLGLFVADQTIGFNYVRWVNEQRILYNVVDNVKYAYNKEVGDIENHIEWSDYIDILGIWNNKPSYKEILKSYRDQNTNSVIWSHEIIW